MSFAESQSFREIREIARLIFRVGAKHRPKIVGDFTLLEATATARLLGALKSKPSLSEAEAVEAMSLDKSYLGSSRYSMFKSRIRAKLLDSLYFLDLERSAFSSYAVRLYNLKRAVFMANVLDSLGARQLAISIAKKGLVDAREVEEWSSALQFLAVLRANASQAGKQKSHEVYTREFLHCQKLFGAEHEADIAMERLQLKFSTSRGEKPELAQDADEAAEGVEVLALQFPSFKLSFLALRLRSTAAQIRMDYDSTLAISETAFSLLNRYPLFANRARRAEYSILRLFAALQSRNFAVAERAIELCNDTLTPQDNNWFVFKQCHFLLSMHTGDFEKARSVITDVFNNTRFFVIPEIEQEKWRLFELYSRFVNGEPVPIDSTQALNNILPSYASDKLGLNTATIILHVLLLADRHQFRQLLDRSDFIRGYRKRFLKGPVNSHSALFFSLLSALGSSDLNYKKIRRRTSKAVVELHRMEQSEPMQGEVILPYVWVWERIVGQLQKYNPLGHQGRIA